MKLVRIFRCLPCKEDIAISLAAPDPRAYDRTMKAMIEAFKASHKRKACQPESGDAAEF